MEIETYKWDYIYAGGEHTYADDLDKLKELGAEEGDTIRILDYEFEYTE